MIQRYEIHIESKREAGIGESAREGGREGERSCERDTESARDRDTMRGGWERENE